ncbi:MAG: hypothetical protein SVX43_06245, partial [Cyanobacteriota bacterium]|nr:hypothetical protein [Cyanobacteriota bacterium]
MYVYRTPAFEKELQRQSSLSESFKSLCAKLEGMTFEQVFSRFERIYPYLKRKEGNLRLIARVYRVGDDRVLCWLKIFRRGDRAYETFLRDRDLDELQEETLQKWLQGQKAAHSRPISPSPPPLDEALLPWLERPNWQIDKRGSIVYESRRWVQRFATAEIQRHWETYSRAIAALADAETAQGEPTERPGITLYCQDNCYILYSKITTADPPARPVLFLLAPFASPPSPAEIAESIAWLNAEGQFLEHIPDAVPLERLTRVAHRAYPSYLLADEENWRLLENEENANLALSAEEEAILHAVSTGQPSLPLFLNGQAGSGKSTMLFHLFADYCHRHLRDARERGREVLAKPHPLFLAYNDRLLEVAKSRVTALLASHHRFLEERGESETLPDLSPFFRTFRAFLLSLLPLEERDRFLETHYVSFHRFHQLWEQKQKTGRKFSPERCWQVIRTFIKGYSLDERNGYLQLEDYREIPNKERTVSPEEFKEIYNSVWKWYESYTKAENLWDDQDLVRTVLQFKCYHPDYTVIFCDEAQDFTCLELQIVIKLSVFSDTDLERYPVRCLPFAFAGDPMQTLNPTGFRWESLKATFYNEAIAVLSPTRQLNVEMNFTELECNYRSVPSIVGANNLIQLWRSVLFEIPELKPQTSRRLGDFEPQKFILESPVADKLIDSLRGTIIIVPCDEGAEYDYARQDEILSRLLSPENDSRSPWNILSAIAAKGLEFKQVVLYKFGEACPPGMWKETLSAPEEIRYFLNKLYVAASRATERLSIVDTQRGERNLWRQASGLEEARAFLAKIPSPTRREKWRKNLGFIQISSPIACFGTNDLNETAEILEKQGLDAKNARVLRRAQGAYQQLQNENKVFLCEAWALKFECKFLEAGRQFLQQGDREQAWDCFWQGMCWHELISLHEKLTADKTSSFSVSSFQLAIVSFLARETTIETLQRFEPFLTREIGEEDLKNYHFSPQWQAAIKTYAREIEVLINQPRASSKPSTRGISDRQWHSWGTSLWRLAEAKYRGMAELAGSCFYRAQNYERAVQCWEAAPARPKILYNLAKAEVLGIPAGLDALLNAQQYDMILALWKQANQPRHPQWLNTVAPALAAKEEPLKALIVYSWLDRLPEVKANFERACKGKSAIKAIKCFWRYTLQHQYWDEAIATVETSLPILLSSEAERVGLKYYLIYVLSRSSLTPETLDRDRRQRLERFIKKRILPTPWTQYLSVLHVGIALEKIGSLVETLEFYERYLDSPVQPLKAAARDRWLATKIRQARHFRDSQHHTRVKRLQAEIRAKAQRWGIDL